MTALSAIAFACGGLFLLIFGAIAVSFCRDLAKTETGKWGW